MLLVNQMKVYVRNARTGGFYEWMVHKKEKKSLKKVVKVTSLVQYQLHTELI